MIRLTLEMEGKSYLISGMNINGYNPDPDKEAYSVNTVLSINIKSFRVDYFLWDWNNNMVVKKKDGRIVIFNVEENTVIQTVTFKDGFVSSYHMNYFVDNIQESETNLVIASNTINVQVNRKENLTASKDERFA